MAIAEDPNSTQANGAGTAQAAAVRSPQPAPAPPAPVSGRGATGGELAGRGAPPQPPLALSASERRLLNDLFAIVSEHAADSAVEIDRGRVQDAFVFACEHHAAQRRKSGEDFIVHPVGVARICTTRSRTPPPRSRRCASASARRYRASSTG